MDVIKELRQLNLPKGQYAVCGSAVLAVRGIREANDIDLLIKEELYSRLKEQGWDERFWPTGRPKELHRDPFDAGTAWSVENYNPDPLRLIAEAEMIEGIPFVRLSELINWKKNAKRPKDLSDLNLIEVYLAEEKP